jgi:Zn-dependent protease with chaperone function
MVPEIPRRDWATPPQIDYTILSITLDPPDPNESPAQKKAFQRQKERAMYQGTGPEPDVRVIHTPDPHPELTKKLRLENQAANLAQEKALQQLKARLKGSSIRVIEVRLEQ